jgi:hypothetical protein
MHHSAETKKQMSDTHKERWKDDNKRKAEHSERMKNRFLDPEYKKRILKNLQAHPPKHGSLSDETKKKLSVAFTGRWLGENSPCSKPVIQYTKDGEFVKKWATARDAERDGIALASNIQKVCNERPHCHTAGGFVWKWA